MATAMIPTATIPSATIHPDVCIGHAHLKVADLERALAFYRDTLGFVVTQRHGDEVAFLAAGDYHHHLALNTWETKGAAPPPPGHTGLHHVAIRYPDRRELARALRQLLDVGVPVWGALDHGVTEAVYLEDPDGNGIELFHDRPRVAWPLREGRLAMGSESLDLGDLLAELGNTPANAR